MAYPDIRAGAKPTPDLLRAMMPLIVVKAATDERDSTVPELDDELQFEAVAGAQYLVEFGLVPAAVSAAGIRTQWVVPLGSSGFKSVLGPASNASTQGAADGITMRAGVHQYGSNVVYAGVRDSNSSAVTVTEWSVVTVGNAGTVGLAWSQDNPSPTPTRMFVGSWMRATRLS